MRVAAAFTRDAAQLRRRRGLRAALGDRRPSRDLPRRAPRPPRALDGGSRDRAPPGDAPRCRWTLAPGLHGAHGMASRLRRPVSRGVPPDAPGRGNSGLTPMSGVLTWTHAPTPPLVSERLRRLQESHHAMWNYVTYRDAIGLLGLDPAAIYPAGSTRLEPNEWADLGWLTCFSGPPPATIEAMRAAVAPESLNHYTPDLIDPLREAAAALLGRRRGPGFEVVGTEGA